MDNYYETCLAEIKQLISESNEHEAIKRVDNELSMPYVPEPYFSEFLEIRDSVRIDTRTNQKFFDLSEDIDNALRGNDLLKQKALISLERMNLRNELEWVSRWLIDPLLEDWIKKTLLLNLMGQDVNQVFEVCFKNQEISCNPHNLKNPQEDQQYIDCVLELHEALESVNPSMLILCLSLLEQIIFDGFPINYQIPKAHDIMRRVETYLNQG